MQKENKKIGQLPTFGEYVDSMARVSGWKATLVYMSISRHLEEGTCSVSLQSMMREHGVSKGTIIRGIKDLEKHKVINVDRERKEDGSFPTNRFMINYTDQWV